MRTARIDAEPQVLRRFLEIEIARLRFLAYQPQIWFEIIGFLVRLGGFFLLPTGVVFAPCIQVHSSAFLRI